MFAGSAAGEWFPPMVVYKAQNVYASWCSRGPKGAIYSCSKSGWFDAFQFEKWFFELMLPKLKRRTGKKLLLGDNLASHISPAVIQACKTNDISFVCLPPNSTDKLQPLDVGVFSSLKAKWRTILTEHKRNFPKETGISKVHFPQLLDKLMKEANPGQHLPAAFEKCGLHPLNVDRAVERIPSRSMECDRETTRELLSSTLGEKLEELRGFNKEKRKISRGKKVVVPPGKSYCDEMDISEEEEEEDEEKDDEKDEEEGREEEEEEEEEEVRRQPPRRMARWDQSEESDEEAEELLDNMEENEEPQPKKTPEYAVGSYVVAVYDGNWFIAQVEGEEPENECEGFTLLKYMDRRGNNQFVWGEAKDQLKTINSDILLRVEPPIPITSRYWGLPKDIVKKVEKLFRVLWSIIFLQFKHLTTIWAFERDTRTILYRTVLYLYLYLRGIKNKTTKVLYLPYRIIFSGENTVFYQVTVF
jgi:hypothetical protein